MSVARRTTGTQYDRKTPRLAVERLEDRLTPNGNSVLDWNAVMLAANAVDHGLAQPDQGGPTRTSRAFAIVQTAVFDAVNGVNRKYTPFLVTQRAPQGADIDAAVAGAAYTTLVGLFPQQQALFDEALSDALREIRDGSGETRGLDYGRFVGNQFLANRANDGSDAPMSYTPTGQPGNHDVDPLHPDQGFLDPQWGEVRPFTLQDGDQFQAPPPPGLRSEDYADAYKEVMVKGAIDAETRDRDRNGRADRTREQTEIGLFWGYDGSPGLGTPPRLYNQIAREISDEADNSLTEDARMLALMNLAMADAGITCWGTKYEYDFWRPILGIREGGNDGNSRTNGDPNWSPLGAPRSNDPGPNGNFTPNFPAYSSGHATFGAAAFEVLESFYRSDRIPGGRLTFVSDELNGRTIDQNGQARPLRPRSFTTFDQMIEENAISRIYLGIHWRFDATEGVEHGRDVADWVFDKYLRPLQSGSSATVAGSDLAASSVAPTPAAPVTEPAPAEASPDQDEVVLLQPAPAPAESEPATVTPAPGPAAGEDGLALGALPDPLGTI